MYISGDENTSVEYKDTLLDLIPIRVTGCY
jgi:hypothetical protein